MIAAAKFKVLQVQSLETRQDFQEEELPTSSRRDYELTSLF